ncbi:heavy metal translocating P-type ATPase [Sulfuriferula nivalis]|uniref:Copper-translocating P-type ATPase n=1 Tax=Sulfuriferula nivalis TaxID=2675298 RepID=A0A809SFD5_9PROT|nr:heavy metal translocating P-type ATPase [Sulfuriferula nivalis]BBP02167.1 copper-translocating P-type ATPase [Sulfuriferula nivalis]
MIDSTSCYHCGQTIPPKIDYRVKIAGHEHGMCCRGCQAVAQSIVDNGLEAYYQSRTAMPASGQEVLPDEIKKLALYDHPDIQRSFVIVSGENAKEAVLILEGITCAACVWLNERHIRQLDGVISVEVNYASHRARVAWDERKINLSTILKEIQLLGYNAHPYNAHQADKLRKTKHKKDLQRIAIAGIASAQVMMLAVGLYAGAWYGMTQDIMELLRWFSMMLTIPVATFAAMPFYRSAWSGIKSGHLNMDVPVALAIITAFLGSVWVTVFGGAHVYYDTIGMFTLFLLATRLLETGAREKSVEAAENLLKLQPAMAMRIKDGQQSYVPVMELMPDDLILVKSGEAMAADGIVVEGESTADESLLTGESRAIIKVHGSGVIAGSVNLDSPLVIRVTGVGEDTVLAGIVRLVDKAQAEKPKIAQLADKVAAWFTWGLLLFALAVGVVWLLIDHTRAFEIVLSVLVVTCPCALSLAVPAALAAAGSHLIKKGILVLRGHAMETLAHVTHVVFDKTGTLTVGHPVIVDIRVFADISIEESLKIAASLEQISEHPLARAFVHKVEATELYPVINATNVAGQGIAAEISGVSYTIGNQGYALASKAYAITDLQINSEQATLVWLCDATRVIAVFALADDLRVDAKMAVEQLQSRGISVSILSGDAPQAVEYVARQLGVTDFLSQQRPQDKFDQLKRLQAQGAVVAMVGDGVNDAPVLSGAQVSFAMGTGTDVASQSSDVVLLSSKLTDVVAALDMGKNTLVVMRQNLIWAVVYNLTALPFAAMGYVSPWLAALGMSLSSLIVVLNALRLK